MTDGPAPAAVVLTQVAVPAALAAACAVHKVAVDAVPTPIGCVAVCHDVAGADAAARAVSGMLANTRVVLLVQRDGRMTASRWAGGEHAEDLSAALMLDGAPSVVEGLLLGTAVAAEQPGVVTSAGMGRLRAMRALAGLARDARRTGG